MKKLRVVTMLLIGASVVAASAARGEQQQMPPGCTQIVAVLDQGGGGLSAEEVAKKTGTDVETVRNCTDLWRRTMKDPNAPRCGAPRLGAHSDAESFARRRRDRATSVAAGVVGQEQWIEKLEREGHL